jgi:DNA polymerase-3 subunit alpha
MSIKEKKTSKGNLFAIVKFSDLSKTYELFLFSEILEKNKDELKVGNSFLLTILRDKQNKDNRFRRISVRKVEKISDVSKITYSNVHIEIDKSDNLEKLYQSLKEKGDSVIKISIYDTGKNYLFELKDKRKFNYETFKNLNKEHFIKKISI